jgi:hypothetical protein
MRLGALMILERIRTKPSTGAPSIGSRLQSSIDEYILSYRGPLV